MGKSRSEKNKARRARLADAERRREAHEDGAWVREAAAAYALREQKSEVA